jgi:iron complex transport system substrate-binding protein
MPAPALRSTFVAFLLFATLPASAVFTVQDDAGQDITFERPATRIVSLAPSITELLFAAGAGTHVIAADEYSDYPEAARKLPRIGNAHALDLETLLALKPDLVIAWKSGNDARQLARLREVGIRIFLSEPRTLEDIPHAVETFGKLAGTESTARAVAEGLRKQAAQLKSRYANRTPVRVFFEIWSPPIMTVNGTHMIDAVLRLCGGENAFAALSTLTPSVSIESVVAANPEVILASGMGNERPPFLDAWQSWPRLPAVQHGLVAAIPADLIARPGPRIFEGAGQVCEIIDRARGVSNGASGNASSGNKQP